MLELGKLQKSYRKNEVLRDASITVKDGESVCFVGANGAGKSTLLKIIVGALKPDAGTILWNGKAVDGTFLSEHVGYVPQENPLFEDLTVKDNLELWYAKDKASLQKDLEDGWLFYFGMHKIYKKPVKKLSGGMKKRLSICCALAGDPDVLVMDEPGAALDLMAKNEILRLIKNFTRKGKSVIITSHEMSEITFCHSLYGISKLPVSAVYASLRSCGSATTIASTRHPGIMALRGRDGVSTRRSTCTMTFPRFALTA